MNTHSHYHRAILPEAKETKVMNDRALMSVSLKKLENMNCIFKQSEHLGGLYLGDVISTLKEEILQGSNVRAVLSCMTQRVSIRTDVKAHKIMPIKDLSDYPIINHFDQAIAWIHQRRREKKNVLVHCHAGVSRSATIIIAYLIRTERLNPAQALELVRKQRQRAKPNPGFWKQLNDYYNYWSKQPYFVQKSQNQTVWQKENRSVNENRQSLFEKRENQPARISFFQKRKLFERREMDKSMDQHSKREEIDASYLAYTSKLVTKRDRCSTQLRSPSLITDSQCFSQNKSMIQPRSFNINQTYPFPHKILTQTQNTRPLIRFI